MNEEDSKILGEVTGQLLSGVAMAMAAMVEALGQQPAVDREKLVHDMLTALPDRSEDQLADALYRSLAHLLAP